MNTKSVNQFQEDLIYLIFWILVFIFPILLSTGGHRIDWIRILREYIRIVPFLILFLMNNFYTFKFFKKGKYYSYFYITGGCILLISLIATFSTPFFNFLSVDLTQKITSRIDRMWLLNTFFYNSLFSVLVIGLNDSIKVSISWLEDKRKFEQLQKENLENQLSLLKHQISPHFFMNTLNNIHALIDYDKEIAKNSVAKLAHLMRVLLYENEKYTLQKEINFLHDYIELMKIRVNSDVNISFTYPPIIPQIDFPTLLFISFVENSFKHGIKAIGNSFIDIQLSINDQCLFFSITNSKAIKKQSNVPNFSIGMNNSKKRLDLIYADNYNYEVIETDNTYQINIILPLNDNKVPCH